MAQSLPQPFLFRLLHRLIGSRSSKKGKKQFVLDKRQKFGIGVVILSLGLFLSEYVLNAYGLLIACFLGIISDLVLLWAIHEDLKNNLSIPIFILPFLYSISFGLFSFLTPARLLTRIILTALYAVGLYSVFLSENIFTIASIRSIALLHSARIVSLIISLITYFFLLSTALSFRTNLLPTIVLIAVFSFLVTTHTIWTYTLEKAIKKDLLWVSIISLCSVEIGLMIWFWPTSPIVTALFLTSMWYVLVGLAHVWLDKRLFKNVLWEYVWVAVIALLILIAFTQWRG